MYLAVIESSSSYYTPPHVVLSHSPAALHRKVAEILLAAANWDSEVAAFLAENPVEINDPGQLADWLTEFHNALTTQWVTTYITSQCVPTDSAIEGITSDLSVDSPIPFLL